MPSKKRVTCPRLRNVIWAGADRWLSRLAISVMASASMSPVGNAHELDALKAGLSKIQARLSATEDDDELDALVAVRKSVKARIEGFEVIADSFDYAPTGQTVSCMWSGADAAKRGMVRAVKGSWGLILAEHGGQRRIVIGAAASGGIPARGNDLASVIRYAGNQFTYSARRRPRCS
jgi:hypothetical protein